MKALVFAGLRVGMKGKGTKKNYVRDLQDALLTEVLKLIGR